MMKMWRAVTFSTYLASSLWYSFTAASMGSLPQPGDVVVRQVSHHPREFEVAAAERPQVRSRKRQDAITLALDLARACGGDVWSANANGSFAHVWRNPTFVDPERDPDDTK